MNVKQSVISRYNDLIEETYGIEERFVTNERNNKWNIRDMISELQYILDCYNDPSCLKYVEAHEKIWNPKTNRIEKNKEAYTTWSSGKRKLEGFIKKHENEAMNWDCYTNHGSKYDN